MKKKLIKDYNPTREEIHKMVDDFFEENKEWLEKIIKGLGND